MKPNKIFDNINKYSSLLFQLLILFAIAACESEIKPEKPEKPEPKPPVEQGFVRKISNENYTEYRTGNYPLIITVSHGGKETSSEIAVRTAANCPDPNFTNVLDTNSPELANAIDAAVYTLTGKRPYYISLKLKRTYLDVNRKKEYAFASGPTAATAESIYNHFYGKIAEAKKEITEQYGSGLILDIHSHGHDKEEIEIGYQISSKNLNMSDEDLNNSDLAKETGIYNLIKKNKQKISFAEHIRGELSFGTILNGLGTPCIPHSKNKMPKDTPYQSSGNITKVNGSCSGGTIDALQLECNKGSKDTESARKTTAENLAKCVQNYLELHYDLKH